MSALRGEFSNEPSDSADVERFERRWSDFLKDIRIRLGTLSKVNNVSLLLGAGASRTAGGPLLGSVPIEVERILVETGVANDRVYGWLEVFYSAVAVEAEDPAPVPASQEEILRRAGDLGSAVTLQINCELVLSRLYAWSHAFPPASGPLALAGPNRPSLCRNDVEECMRRLTSALVSLCLLPSTTASGDPLLHHRDLLKKLLTRPLTLKRVNVFTLNYDTLVEQAADAEGAVLLDGFVGSMRRVFRPESYDHDLYFRRFCMFRGWFEGFQRVAPPSGYASSAASVVGGGSRVAAVFCSVFRGA